MTKLHVDEEIYKEAQSTVQNLIRKKKKAYFEEKLKENTANPKKLWKTLKQLGLPEISLPCTDVCLKVEEDLKFDTFTISELFKNYIAISQMIQSTSFLRHLKTIQLSHNLNFESVQPNIISNLLKSCNVNKAAGIDNASGRFLKDGANVLGIPITQICNLSIKLSHLPKDWQA